MTYFLHFFLTIPGVLAAPHHLHHTLRWQRPLCWPRYWCEDAVWQLKSFRWVGFEFSRQGGISLLDAFNIDFLSGLDANKVTPQQNKFFPKVRVCSTKNYLWFAVDVYWTLHQKNNITIFSIYHTTPKILFSTKHITITWTNLWNIWIYHIVITPKTTEGWNTPKYSLNRMAFTQCPSLRFLTTIWFLQ